MKGKETVASSTKSRLAALSGTRSRWLIILIMILLSVLLIFFWLKKPEAKTETFPVVEVMPVDTTTINIYGEYVGRIRAQQFVEIHARVEGYLERMLFKEGSHIEKGQTLFIIDPRLYEARLNRAKAQLNKAKAQAQKADRDL